MAPSISRPYFRLAWPGPKRCAGIISARRSRVFSAPQVMHATTYATHEANRRVRLVATCNKFAEFVRRVLSEAKREPAANLLNRRQGSVPALPTYLQASFPSSPPFFEKRAEG